MKIAGKYLGLAMIAFCFLAVPSAMANPTYWMETTGVGELYTTGNVVGKLNAALPTGSHTIPPDFGIVAPGGSSWDLAGWWEFGVTGSTANTPGSNWNEVFAGGEWDFKIQWDGSISAGNMTVAMPSAIFNQGATWSQMYGNWFENNANCYTFFSLYVNPASGGASTPGNPPVGVFAFVLDSDYANFDPAKLTQLMGSGTDWTIGARGEGIATATAAVPEPTTLLLLSLGLVGMGAWKLKKKQ
jgi:hypothetical protein